MAENPKCPWCCQLSGTENEDHNAVLLYTHQKSHRVLAELCDTPVAVHLTLLDTFLCLDIPTGPEYVNDLYSGISSSRA